MNYNMHNNNSIEKANSIIPNHNERYGTSSNRLCSTIANATQIATRHDYTELFISLGSRAHDKDQSTVIRGRHEITTEEARTPPHSASYESSRVMRTAKQLRSILFSYMA